MAEKKKAKKPGKILKKVMGKKVSRAKAGMSLAQRQKRFEAEFKKEKSKLKYKAGRAANTAAIVSGRRDARRSDIFKGGTVGDKHAALKRRLQKKHSVGSFKK
tara:strand:- start:1448 stop:1756 length:309 start_codon:yes stop_codon:yes gene_type:complete